MSMVIRDVKKEDFEKMLSIYRYYVEETTISFEEEVPSLANYSQRLNHILEKYPILVVEENQKLVGYAYAHAFRGFSAYDKVAEVTVYLAKEAGAKGLAGCLYEKLESLLIQKKITKAIACITSDNIPSLKFHKKNGYQQIAEFTKIGYKFNQWLNIIWLEKELQ